MEDKIIAEYRMIVRQSGAVETQLVAQYEVEEKMKKVKKEVDEYMISSRLRQYMGVVEECIKQLSDPRVQKEVPIDEVIQGAMHKVAREEKKYNKKKKEIEYSSVSSKVAREVFDDIEKFTDALVNYHITQGRNELLKIKMWENVSERNPKQDREYLNKKFEEIKKEYYGA